LLGRDNATICDELLFFGHPFTGGIYVDVFSGLAERIFEKLGLQSIGRDLIRSIYRPLVSTPRYMAQRGCFIYQWTVGGTVQKLSIDGDSRLTIAAEAKAEVLRVLDKLNINHSTVYQDFDSIAKYVMDGVAGKEAASVVAASATTVADESPAALEAKIAELKRENATLSARVAALEPKETPSADIASGTAT
jgi:hypothetical protein